MAALLLACGSMAAPIHHSNERLPSASSPAIPSLSPQGTGSTPPEPVLSTSSSPTERAASEPAPAAVPISAPSWPCSEDGIQPAWEPAIVEASNGAAIPGVFVAQVGAHEDAVRSVSFVSNSTLVASVGDEEILRIWDPCRSKAIAEHKLVGSAETVATNARGAIAAATWSGELLFLSSPSSQPRVLRNRGPGVKALAFSPDGSRLAAGGFDKQVRIWSVKAGTAGKAVSSDEDLVYSLAWSHDGKVLAVGRMNGVIELVDVQDARPKVTARLFDRKEIIFSLAFSADDTRLAAGTGNEDSNGDSRDRVVIWQVSSRRLERELCCHFQFIYGVDVSSAGMVASAGVDGTVRLWDLATGASIAILKDASERVQHVAFSSDGKFLLTASGPGKLHGRPGEDNTVRLYCLGALAK